MSYRTEKKLFATQIRAVDPADGELKTWAGPYIEAYSHADADLIRNKEGLGYCEVVGEVVGFVSERVWWRHDAN